MKRLIFNFLIGLFLCFSSMAQNPYVISGKMHVGLSKLGNLTGNNTSDIKFSSSYKPAFHLGGSYRSQNTPILHANLELLFSRYSGEETITYTLYDQNDEVVGDSVTHFNRSVSMLSVPLYYSFLIKKVVYLYAGFQGDLIVGGEGTRNYEVTKGSTVVTEQETLQSLNTKTWYWGLRGGVLVDITQKFDIEATIHFGGGNLLDVRDNSDGPNVNALQMSVGLRYNIKRKDM